MTDSLQKIIERILLVIVCLIGPALFFQMYKSIQKEALAEESSRDFLESVTSSGKISDTEYMLFRDGLALLDGFDTTLNYTTYHNEPVYQFYSATHIADYFNSRNKWDRHYYHTAEPVINDEDPGSLRMQKQTNATVLAKLMEDGLPLGNDAPRTATYTAVVPSQEIYAGEQLVTVVKVDTGDMVYYAVGGDIAPTVDGNYQIYVNGVLTSAVVSVKAWKRQVVCPTCHNTYTCTKEVLDYYKAYHVWSRCPHCASLIKDITVDHPTTSVPIGTKEADVIDISFTATYYNGRTETLALSDMSHNYAAGYAGAQNISVSYKGFHKDNVCTITTVCPNCAGCGAAITNRNAFDCELYPFCSTCMSIRQTYLGECVIVPETFFGEQIANQLIASGSFPMGRDDYLMLSVDHFGNRVGGRYSFLSSDKDIYFRMGKRVRRTGTD